MTETPENSQKNEISSARLSGNEPYAAPPILHTPTSVHNSEAYEEQAQAPKLTPAPAQVKFNLKPNINQKIIHSIAAKYRTCLCCAYATR